MPAPATIDEFLDLIRKSGVAEEARLTSYMQKLRTLTSSVPKEPNKLAGLMVRDGVLTYFQAEQFLQGKWKRFTIGKYRVLERIGSGGMGQVFLCEHKLMRRRVAVKVLPTAKAEDQSSLERFYREARAVAALDHQNIVRAYDIDQEDNLHFLVMEYVDGSSFQDIIKKSGPMDVLRACHYMYWSAIGLQHAHEQGLIHRDIKPGNILVDRQGVVKILDMGLARFFNDDEDLITKRFDENVLGTADYLAPEQALDSHTVDGRADIYGLGATFYFLLTGGPPFIDGTIAQKLIWHQNREPRPLKTLRPEVPDGVVNIIKKMMAKDREARFQSPAELAATLGPWIQTPIQAPPESEMPRMCAAVLAAGGGTLAQTNPAKVTSPGNPTNPAPGSTSRRKGSSAHLAPIPAPPIGPGSSRHPVQQMVAEATSAETAKKITPVPTIEPMPSSEPSSPIWEGISDTNNVSRADTDRKPGSAHRKQPNSSRKPKKPAPEVKTAGKSKKRLWIILGSVLLLLVVMGIFLIASGSKSNSDAPRTFTITKKQAENSAENRLNSVSKAIKQAKPKDRIVILDDEWNEEIEETPPKDLTIESVEGKRVLWKSANQSSGQQAVLNFKNAENLRLKGFTIHANNMKFYALRLEGKCSGTVLEDLEILEARDSVLLLVDCIGESGNPVLLQNLRIMSNAKVQSNNGVEFRTSPTKTKGESSKSNAFIHLEHCRIEGPFKTAAIQIEGSCEEVEFRQNRIFNAASVNAASVNAASGLFIRSKKENVDQVIKLKLTNNTFHTMQGPLLRFENAELLAAHAAKHKIEVSRNYFVNITGGLLKSDDNKPAPSIFQTENARNLQTPDAGTAFPTQVLDIPLSTDGKDDKTFLRNDALKEAGPNKTPVGYTGS